MASRQDFLAQRDRDVLVIVLLGVQFYFLLVTVWAWCITTTCLFFFTMCVWTGALMNDNTIFYFHSFRKPQETKED